MSASQPDRPDHDAAFLDRATRIIFMGGLNRQVVDNKWDHFREVFHGFDPEKVATITPEELQDMTEDEGLIRNEAKLEATVANAETMNELADEHGSFRAYVEELFDDRGVDGAAKQLSKHFKYISENGARFWLYSTGFDIGEVSEKNQEKYAPYGGGPS